MNNYDETQGCPNLDVEKIENVGVQFIIIFYVYSFITAAELVEMLLKSVVLTSIVVSKVVALPVVDVNSSTEFTEFGAYINSNSTNICKGEKLESLTVCANEVLSRLDECNPNDLACECCALQSVNRKCYGLCPNTASGIFLAILYDDCETMNDVNACSLSFKKHDTQAAKPLKPNFRIPVEEKNPDFVIKSNLLVKNNTNTSNKTANYFYDSNTFVQDSSVTNLVIFNTSHLNATQEENKAKWCAVQPYSLILATFFGLLAAAV